MLLIPVGCTCLYNSRALTTSYSCTKGLRCYPAVIIVRSSYLMVCVMCQWHDCTCSHMKLHFRLGRYPWKGLMALGNCCNSPVGEMLARMAQH